MEHSAPPGVCPTQQQGGNKNTYSTRCDGDNRQIVICELADVWRSCSVSVCPSYLPSASAPSWVMPAENVTYSKCGNDLLTPRTKASTGCVWAASLLIKSMMTEETNGRTASTWIENTALMVKDPSSFFSVSVSPPLPMNGKYIIAIILCNYSDKQGAWSCSLMELLQWITVKIWVGIKGQIPGVRQCTDEKGVSVLLVINDGFILSEWNKQITKNTKDTPASLSPQGICLISERSSNQSTHRSI